MVVVDMKQYRSRDSVDLFEQLAALAREGKVGGAAVTIVDVHGKEFAAFTGVYNTDPAKACYAAMRMSWKLTKRQTGQSVF